MLCITSVTVLVWIIWFSTLFLLWDVFIYSFIFNNDCPDSMATLAQRWNMVVSSADRYHWLYNIVSTLAQRWNTVVSLADRRCWLYNIVPTLAQHYTNVMNLRHKSDFLVTYYHRWPNVMISMYFCALFLLASEHWIYVGPTLKTQVMLAF